MIDINNTIKGTLNGYDFSVNATSLAARKIDKALKEDLAAWNDTHNKEYIEYTKKHADDIRKALDNKDYTNRVFVDMPESKDWKDDAEFRAKRWSTMAKAAMKFDKTPPEDLWKSEEIEFGMVDLAFDFFTGGRTIPMDLLIR